LSDSGLSVDGRGGGQQRLVLEQVRICLGRFQGATGVLYSL
jgi:hypothetical protein